MSIPCDGIVTKASELQIDESSLTGEFNMNWKCTIENFKSDLKMGANKEPSPIIVSGSVVANGEGFFIALAVGPKSIKG